MAPDSPPNPPEQPAPPPQAPRPGFWAQARSYLLGAGHEARELGIDLKSLAERAGEGILFLPWKTISRGAGLLVAGMGVGALILAYLSAGEIYDYLDTVDGVHLPKVDVIVCLAGGRGRISAAGDLWYRYHEQTGRFGSPPLLYISGMGHQSDWSTFSPQLRKGVQAAIQPRDVILETESENTEENARVFVRFARSRGWERMLLVTSRYHMRRARMMFDRVLRISGQPMEIETSSVYQEPFEPGEWRGQVHGIQVTLTEYMKWLYYRVVWRPKVVPTADDRLNLSSAVGTTF